MAERPKEDCAVCWRSFSQSMPPYSIPCGHSYCHDCSTNLSRCPLCRKRLIHGYPRVKNFSLLSLIDRMAMAKTELRDQQVQTEYSLPVKKPRPPKQDLPLTMEQLVAKPLALKFHKDSLGNIKRFEVKFK